MPLSQSKRRCRLARRRLHSQKLWCKTRTHSGQIQTVPISGPSGQEPCDLRLAMYRENAHCIERIQKGNHTQHSLLSVNSGPKYLQERISHIATTSKVRMLSHSVDEKHESRRPGFPRLIRIISSSSRTQPRLLDSRSWALQHRAFSACSVQLGTSNRMRNHDTRFSLDWGICESPLEVSWGHTLLITTWEQGKAQSSVEPGRVALKA